MNVKELRDKLNELIDEGKGDYEVLDDYNNNISTIKEGKILEIISPFQEYFKEFVKNDYLNDEYYKENKSKTLNKSIKLESIKSDIVWNALNVVLIRKVS